MKKILYASVTAITLTLNIAEVYSLGWRPFGGTVTIEVPIPENERGGPLDFLLGEFAYDGGDFPSFQSIDATPIFPPLPLLVSEDSNDNVNFQDIARQFFPEWWENLEESVPSQPLLVFTDRTPNSSGTLTPSKAEESSSLSAAPLTKHTSLQVSAISDSRSESRSASVDTSQQTSSSISDLSDDSETEEPAVKRSRMRSESEKQSSVMKWWTRLALSTRKGLLDYKDDKHAWRIFNKIPDVWKILRKNHQEETARELIRPLNPFNTENLLVKHPRILPELCEIGSKEIRLAVIAGIANYEKQSDKKGQKMPLKIRIPSGEYGRYSESIEKIKALVEEDGVVGDIPAPEQSKKRKSAIRVGLIPADGVDMRFRIYDWNELSDQKNRLLSSACTFKQQDVRQRLQLMGSIAFKAFQCRKETKIHAFEWWEDLNKDERYSLLVLHPKALVKLDELSDESIREEAIEQMTAFKDKSDAEKKAGFRIELSVAAITSSDNQLITAIEAIVNEDYRGYFDPDPRHRKLPKGYEATTM